MDYEEIEKGRRRQWDKLQDPEERKRREREARDAERAKEEERRRESYMKRKERKRQEEREVDLHSWEKTKRELLLYAAIAGAVLVLYIGFKVTTGMIRDARIANRFRVVGAQVESDERYFDLSDPIGAWGTWRNAWYRNNIRDLYMMSSPSRQSAVRGRRDQATYLQDEQQRHDQGLLKHDRSVAVKFDDPEIVRLPGSPDHGELAVFRSQPLIRETVFEEPTRWTVAFAWNAERKDWQFVDVRQAEYWRDKWDRAEDIRPVVHRPAQRRSLLEP